MGAFKEYLKQRLNEEFMLESETLTNVPDKQDMSIIRKLWDTAIKNNAQANSHNKLHFDPNKDFTTIVNTMTPSYLVMSSSGVGGESTGGTVMLITIQGGFNGEYTIKYNPDNELIVDLLKEFKIIK